MQELRRRFRERALEVTRYVSTLTFVENHNALLVSHSGQARLHLDMTTRHVLKASVFLHLYNLVESTVTACLLRVSDEIRTQELHYGDLSAEWRRIWLHEFGKASQPLAFDTRLENLLEVCDRVVTMTTVDFQPSLGNSGNLDDSKIEKLMKRHGIEFKLNSTTERRVKRPVVDKDGPMKVIKLRRNQLAHGLSSFGDCGRTVSLVELREWTTLVIVYLRSVIAHFDSYVAGARFKAAGS